MEPTTIDLAAVQAHNEQVAAVQQKAFDQGFEATLSQLIKDQVAQSGNDLQKTFIGAIGVLIRFLDQHTSEVSVSNHPDPISVDPVVKAVEANTAAVEASNQRLDNITGKETDFSAVISMLEQLEQTIINRPTAPAPPTTVSVDNHPDLTPHFDNLNSTISGLQQPAPIVNTAAPDLAPIQEQLAANSSKILSPQLNLATYRAHDLDQLDPDAQYIGFVNIDGYWYILRNDIKNNSLRYHFGYGNYMDAWSIVSTLSYEPLQDAIKAISGKKKK